MEKRIFAITTLVEKIPEAERNQTEHDALEQQAMELESAPEEEASSSPEKTQKAKAGSWFIKE